MTFTFPKGKHRARPLYWLNWWPLMIFRKKITRKVMFWWDSKYKLDGIDQQDHNKLFGLAFGPVHRNSARFGWRWDPARQKFIISAYRYSGGKRIMEDLCEATGNHWYKCTLEIVNNSMGRWYSFRVTDEQGNVSGGTYLYRARGQHIFAFLLGPYFGGNNPAPAQLTIDIKKDK